jgi:hypothetical protein
MVTKLWAEKSQVQILAGARYFFFQNFQTGSGTYPPSYSPIPGSPFPRDMVARV